METTKHLEEALSYAIRHTTALVNTQSRQCVVNNAGEVEVLTLWPAEKYKAYLDGKKVIEWLTQEIANAHLRLRNERLTQARLQDMDGRGL